MSSSIKKWYRVSQKNASVAHCSSRLLMHFYWDTLYINILVYVAECQRLNSHVVWMKEKRLLANLFWISLKSSIQKFVFDVAQYCQTWVQTISRSTLDASQVLSNSISISHSGGLNLSRHCNCKIPPKHPPTHETFWSLQEHSRTFLTPQTIPNYTNPYHNKQNHTKLYPETLGC